MGHVVLLGDSVFDNGAYVRGGPDVVRQLGAALGSGYQSTLAAVDGSVIADVPTQLARVPASVTHLVVSIGGNDALRQAAVINAPASSVTDALDQLSAVATGFGTAYARMLDQVMQRGVPVAVCTIYDPRFANPLERVRGRAALTVLNDVLLREAFRRSVTVLDLRLICAADEDFANPIEPSAVGGRRIAEAIAAFVTGDHPGRQVSKVIGGSA